MTAYEWRWEADSMTSRWFPMRSLAFDDAQAFVRPFSEVRFVRREKPEPRTEWRYVSDWATSEFPQRGAIEMRGLRLRVELREVPE